MNESKNTGVIGVIYGSFLLTIGPVPKLQYPETSDGVMILRNGFNSINVRGILENASLQVLQTGANRTRQVIFDLSNSGKIDETIPFPFNDNSGFIQFELVPSDLKNPISKADLSFSLENVTVSKYDRLAKKYHIKMN